MNTFNIKVYDGSTVIYNSNHTIDDTYQILVIDLPDNILVGGTGLKVDIENISGGSREIRFVNDTYLETNSNLFSGKINGSINYTGENLDLLEKNKLDADTTTYTTEIYTKGGTENYNTILFKTLKNGTIADHLLHLNKNFSYLGNNNFKIAGGGIGFIIGSHNDLYNNNEVHVVGFSNDLGTVGDLNCVGTLNEIYNSNGSGSVTILGRANSVDMNSSGGNVFISGNGNGVKPNNYVYGISNYITGTNNFVVGTLNTVTNNTNTVLGNTNTVSGSNNIIVGNGITVGSWKEIFGHTIRKDINGENIVIGTEGSELISDFSLSYSNRTIGQSIINNYILSECAYANSGGDYQLNDESIMLMNKIFSIDIDFIIYRNTEVKRIKVEGIYDGRNNSFDYNKTIISELGSPGLDLDIDITISIEGVCTLIGKSNVGNKVVRGRNGRITSLI